MNGNGRQTVTADYDLYSDCEIVARRAGHSHDQMVDAALKLYRDIYMEAKGKTNDNE